MIRFISFSLTFALVLFICSTKVSASDYSYSTFVQQDIAMKNSLGLAFSLILEETPSTISKARTLSLGYESKMEKQLLTIIREKNMSTMQKEELSEYDLLFNETCEDMIIVADSIQFDNGKASTTLNNVPDFINHLKEMQSLLDRMQRASK